MRTSLPLAASLGHRRALPPSSIQPAFSTGKFKVSRESRSRNLKSSALFAVDTVLALGEEIPKSQSRRVVMSAQASHKILGGCKARHFLVGWSGSSVLFGGSTLVMIGRGGPLDNLGRDVHSECFTTLNTCQRRRKKSHWFAGLLQQPITS